jgi:hypothetical protein
MPDRVTKRRATSATASARALLASRIFADGVEVMPCQYCFRHQKVCKVAKDSSRCAECVRRGRACSGTSVASSRELFLILPFLMIVNLS